MSADLSLHTGKTDEARQIIQALPALMKADREISYENVRQWLDHISDLEVNQEAVSLILEDLHLFTDYVGSIFSVGPIPFPIIT